MKEQGVHHSHTTTSVCLRGKEKRIAPTHTHTHTHTHRHTHTHTHTPHSVAPHTHTQTHTQTLTHTLHWSRLSSSHSSRLGLPTLFPCFCYQYQFSLLPFKGF